MKQEQANASKAEQIPMTRAWQHVLAQLLQMLVL